MEDHKMSKMKDKKSEEKTSTKDKAMDHLFESMRPISARVKANEAFNKKLAALGILASAVPQNDKK
jgi:hypothetical protein